jgi:hypothetical protein
MYIYIAKHFWKNGESSTWECHNKIDKELFRYLKNNYTSFSKDRPKYIEVDNHFIYFCYVDTKDNYNRDIVNITFFIVRKKIKISFCDNKNIHNLEIKIFDIQRVFFIVFGFLTIGSVLYFLYFTSLKEEKTIVAVEKQYSKNEYSNFIQSWNKQIDIKEKNKFRLKLDDNLTFMNRLNSLTKTDFFTKKLNEDEIREKLKELTGKRNIFDIVQFIEMNNQ